MRIAFVVTSFPEGAPGVVAPSALAFARRGHAVHILELATTRPAGAPTPPVFPAHVPVTVRAIASPQSPWRRPWRRAAAAPRAQWGGLRRSGGAGSGAAPAPTPGEAPHAHGAEAFDVLYCQSAALAHTIMTRRSAGVVRGRVIVHVRDDDVTRPARERGETDQIRACRDADYFVASSSFAKDAAVALGCPAERVSVIGAGVRVNDIPFRAPRAVEAGPIRFISMGPLTAQKGFHRALGALARLRGKGLAVTYDLIGDGSEREHLGALAARLGLSESVRFHGACSTMAAHRLLDAAHVMLAPSMRTREGVIDAAPDAVQQAMAMGVPVVATRHASLADLVRDGVTGVLVRENDAIALGNGVLALLERNDDWPAMAARGRDHLRQSFSVEAVTDKLLSAYTAAQTAPSAGDHRDAHTLNAAAGPHS